MHFLLYLYYRPVRSVIFFGYFVNRVDVIKSVFDSAEHNVGVPHPMIGRDGGSGVKSLLQNDDLLVLVTVTVPHDLKQMTVNLMGPFIINVKEKKAAQTIIDNDDYPVKFPIYDILQKNKEANS